MPFISDLLSIKDLKGILPAVIDKLHEVASNALSKPYSINHNSIRRLCLTVSSIDDVLPSDEMVKTPCVIEAISIADVLPNFV